MNNYGPWSSNIFQTTMITLNRARIAGEKMTRSPFDKIQLLNKVLTYSLFIFIGYGIADLAILAFRDQMLPKSAPPTKPQKMSFQEMPGRVHYSNVITRNIFNPDGQIPATMQSKTQSGKPEEKEAAPVPSQLPLSLIGTLVHSNPAKSLAAIDVKGKNQVLSYLAGKEIQGLATIVSVERSKVIIRNLSNQRLEYIEMKNETGKISFAGNSSSATVDIENKGQTQFELKKADVMKMTSNLQSILMQASGQPVIDPTTGMMNGYRINNIQPNSLFSKLGLQKMDVIKGVNGNPIDSMQKAMELYKALMNESKITVSVDRGGRKVDLNFSIKQ